MFKNNEAQEPSTMKPAMSWKVVKYRITVQNEVNVTY